MPSPSSNSTLATRELETVPNSQLATRRLETDRSLIFYDGHCALCHASVRFIARHDPRGLFAFAPLDGPTFREAVPQPRRERLPDSVIVLTRDGRLLMHSTAALHILHRLGGVWRVMAVIGRLVPRPLRDGVYRLIAVVRRYLFPRPRGVCPLMSPELRARCLP